MEWDISNCVYLRRRIAFRNLPSNPPLLSVVRYLLRIGGGDAAKGNEKNLPVRPRTLVTLTSLTRTFEESIVWGYGERFFGPVEWLGEEWEWGFSCWSSFFFVQQLSINMLECPRKVPNLNEGLDLKWRRCFVHSLVSVLANHLLTKLGSTEAVHAHSKTTHLSASHNGNAASRAYIKRGQKKQKWLSMTR